METTLGERRGRGQQNSPGSGREVVFPEEPLEGRSLVDGRAASVPAVASGSGAACDAAWLPQMTISIVFPGSARISATDRVC
jgi:hypothetical protein